MSNNTSKILWMAFLPLFILSCSNTKVNQSKQSEKMNDKDNISAIGPRTIVYKTKADYNNNVPVTLSEDKSEIISYPGIKDIYYQGKLAYPTRLNNGYLLDNRGIDKNVAFLNFTYEEYSNLEKTPTPDELINNILDKDPLTEMYNCGSRFDFKEILVELNEIIDNQKLNSYQQIK